MINHSSQEPVYLVEKLLLVAILVLAFFMASIPHWEYAYPLHIDEWWHYGDTQSLIETEGIPFPDPFESGELLSPDKEVGFHLFLGEIKLITGVSWLGLFRYLPGVLLALLAFQAYAFGRGRKSGLGAAFLVVLIPTTVRFLGPAFLVPVSLGLAFVPLTLFALHRLMIDLRGPAVLFLVFLTLLFVHPPTLAVVSFVATLHFILFVVPGAGRIPSRARQSVVAMVLLLSVYCLMFFWAPSFLDFVIKEALNPQAHIALPPIMDVIPRLGYIPVILFVLGAGILFHDAKRVNLAVVFSAMGLLAFVQLYPRFYVGPDIVYERGWLFIYVLMALLGGIALVQIGHWTRKALQRWSLMSAAFSCILTGMLVITAFSAGLSRHLSEPYYHVIDEAKYQDYLWVREHVAPDRDVGVLNTSEAWAFASVSGKFAYTSEISPNFHAKGRSAMEFLRGGANDVLWLKERGIDIVYASRANDSDELVKVHNNVYLLVE